METSFTPVAGLIGGALMGLASALLLLANGRIAGISGILGRSMFSGGTEAADRAGNEAGERDEALAWRLAFLVGLPLGAPLGAWAAGQLSPGAAADFAIASNPLLLVAAGLLVGVGTQLGNGCTSGHGVCGMARRSRRSIVATVTFMAAAGLTVFVLRHLLGGIA